MSPSVGLKRGTGSGWVGVERENFPFFCLVKNSYVKSDLKVMLILFK